ncbi:TPA: glycine zipper family protein, partial [Klebsiella pneumoniae]|nr:glycine zipper family protein [Klebsiella pneumoniae]
ARVVQVTGIVFTAYDLEQASKKSLKNGSVKPIPAEVIRQAGGWGMAVAGAKIGTVAGAAVGIETGPGVVLTGLIGGVIFGTAGYFGADWVADHIDEN